MGIRKDLYLKFLQVIMFRCWEQLGLLKSLILIRYTSVTEWLTDLNLFANTFILDGSHSISLLYLLQIRPGSSSISGIPDKTQLSRTELWTKDVIDYLQHLLDEFFSRNNSLPASHNRDRSPQMLYAGSVPQRSDPASTVLDGEEPSLHFKWWYVVRLLQWHHAEGLLLPTLVIEWVLRQLQVLHSFCFYFLKTYMLRLKLGCCY